MPSWRLTGRVVTGLGRGATFCGLPWVREQVMRHFGIEIHPGTLNLRLEATEARAAWARALTLATVRLDPPDRSSCSARACAVQVGGMMPAIVVVPEVAGYPADQLEIIAALNLREELRLRDADLLEVRNADVAGIRAVIFDVDGTLVNSIEGMHLAVSRAAALFGYEVPPGAVRRALDHGESLWQLIMPEDRQDDRELALLLRSQTMRHWPEILRESVDVFPGLDQSLARLRTAGLRLAICTGSRGESFLPLQRSGLLAHFDPIITARDVARPKPDPEGLHRCLEALACEPGEVVYVGDSRHDVEAGRAAGMRVIGVLSGAGDSVSLSRAGAHRLAPGHDGVATLLLGPPAP